jgi:hypothetical protein
MITEKESFAHFQKWENNGRLKLTDDKFAMVRLFTEEQFLMAQEKGKQVFRAKRTLPNGNQFEFPYILVTYEDAIRNAL